MKISTLLFSALGVAAFASNADAFDKRVHSGLTRKAAALHNLCFPNEPLSEPEMTAFAQGAEGEDNGLLPRGTNWHFYNPHRPLGRFAALFHTGLDDIFKYRIGRAFDAQARDLPERWNLAGRVAHYLQDMAVPAHVVPVYHGPGIHDGFDGYETHPEASFLSIDASAACPSLVNDPMPNTLSRQSAKDATGMLMDSLNAIAGHTLAAIDEPISPGGVSWSRRFWCSPQPRCQDCGTCESTWFPGFGTYIGGSEAFGKDPGVAQKDYRKLFAARYQEAVVETARLARAFRLRWPAPR